MDADRISEWFEQHPETLCGLCEIERATTFRELWQPSSESVSIDWAAEHPGTPICDSCMPSLLHVPKKDHIRADRKDGRADNVQADEKNWDYRYWSFVRKHTECDGTPAIKDEPEEEPADDFSFVILSAQCPGCGQAWNETVEAEALAHVDLADLRLAVTDPVAHQQRAVERTLRLEEEVKRILPSDDDTPPH